METAHERKKALDSRNLAGSGLLRPRAVDDFEQWTASGRPVRAASEDVQFQLQGVRQDSSLLVYYAGERTVYLYQGVMVGNAALQCNYRFKLGEPGGVIRREPCAVQRLLP